MNYKAGIILVVDDESNSREALAFLLKRQGHKVLNAEGGEQALTLMAENPPDVVLLDIAMPGMDGIEVCRRIKENPLTTHIPVLMLTGLANREDRLRAMGAGANDFIIKPPDTEEVALRVRNAVYSKHLYDQLQQNYRRLKQIEELRRDLTTTRKAEPDARDTENGSPR